MLDVEGQIVFVVAAFAVAGLAWALGEATEQAGESAGPRVSALLNASFGNLPEVVILVLAINAGLEDIARASIIGSVIGNILLILGLALLLGGWKNGIQTFNQRVAGMNSSMLVLGVVGLGIPTLFFAIEPNVGCGAHPVPLDGAAAAGLLRRPTSTSRSRRPACSSPTSRASSTGRGPRRSECSR